MAQKTTTTLFIGGGNMGTAILTGFSDSGGEMDSVCVVDPFMEVDAGGRLGLRGLYRRMDEIPEGVEFDIIVLAIKPQIFDTFDAAWAHRLAKDGMVISIMAGVGSDRIKISAGRDCDVIRCMPNMAAAVGRSVNVAFATNPPRKRDFQMLFSGSGPVKWINAEEDIHLTTAVSGSGPAYFFAFVEALAFAGEKAGLDGRFSLDLAIDTMIGAAELLKENRTPAGLRESVTSKGGTTAAALNALAKNDALQTAVENAVRAAKERSRALA